MHEIVKENGKWGVTEGRKAEFLGLPSGEFIRPENVEAVRVIPDRAERSTGQISTRVGIDHRGSWFMVHFENAEDAKAYALALAGLCNKVRRGVPMGDEPRGKEIDRSGAHALIEELSGIAGKHAGPEDMD